MECCTSQKMRRARSLAVAITGLLHDAVIMSCELERRLRNTQPESNGRIEVQVTATSGKESRMIWMGGCKAKEGTYENEQSWHRKSRSFDNASIALPSGINL